ncbi:MAG: transglycosylase SLT domain-containing protein [Patescibacteria group bacterium]|mgnify:CR=1 FL=1
MAIKSLIAILCFITTSAFAGDETENHNPLHDPGWIKSAKEAIPVVLRKYETLIQKESREAGIPPQIVTAVLVVESLGRNDRKGPAQGLMQTRLVVAKELGSNCDRQRPECSIRKGAQYLALLRERYGLSIGPELFLGYLKGPQGMRKVRNPGKHEYSRRIVYVIESLPEGAFSS